eukprot:11196029-Lingulodinium_polyedra.AAC.1
MVPSKYDLEILGGCLGALARRALAGRACLRTAAPDGSTRFSAVTGDRALRMMGLVPIGLELRVRRLRWLQRICTSLEGNRQLLGAVLGEFPFEKEKVVTPWERQWCEDLDSLAAVEEGGELLG